MDIPLHGSSTTAEGDNPRSRRLRRQLIVLVATLLVVFPSLFGDAAPQAASRSIQTTGTIGSPSATTTIPGNQLPAPDPTFGGVIKETALLAHARRPDQRQKPPLDGLWRDLGDGYRLPVLR